MYDSEDYKIQCWEAAAYGARALANALPFAVTIAAVAFLIQSVLSQPFTLACKSEPMQTTAPAVVIEPDAKASGEKKVEEAPQAEPSTIQLRKEQY